MSELYSIHVDCTCCGEHIAELDNTTRRSANGLEYCVHELKNYFIENRVVFCESCCRKLGYLSEQTDEVTLQWITIRINAYVCVCSAVHKRVGSTDSSKQ